MYRTAKYTPRTVSVNRRYFVRNDGRLHIIRTIQRSMVSKNMWYMP